MRVVPVSLVLLAFLAQGSPARNVSMGRVVPTPCAKVFTYHAFAVHARAVYSRSEVTRRAQRRVQTLRVCQRTPTASVKARRYTRRLRAAYKARRALTPYPCGGGYYAVPCAIVECEGGPGNWNRMNASGSGAYGPYQLLGHVPIPSPPSVQHAAAARLWKASGTGPWLASRGCWAGRV